MMALAMANAHVEQLLKQLKLTEHYYAPLNLDPNITFCFKITEIQFQQMWI